MEPRVLIVDDSPALRQAARRAVAKAGVKDERILEAEGGVEALQLLTEEAVDLILLDLHMPGMDGAAFVAATRTDPRTSGIPVVVVATEDERALSATLGVHGFLNKPFEPEELRDLVAELGASDA